MPKQNDPTNNTDVEIIEVKSSIRQRAIGIHGREGDEGFIPDELIEEANKEVEKLCANCTDVMNVNLVKLSDLWSRMRDLPAGDERSKLSQDLFFLAHEIKDVSAMCGYDLISYFAESLRDYINKAELSMKAQRVIVQAHLDAITVAHHRNLKTDEGTATAEIKSMVKKAIEQYS
jgi:chemotaxis protein histidine kinase CheA